MRQTKHHTGKDTLRWAAVCAGDAAARDRFVFAVATTGIYCRPGCPARRPLRANVRFFADPAAARDAGYRACRRCHPDRAGGAATSAAAVAGALGSTHPSAI